MNSKLLFYLLLFLSTTCFDNIINVRWLNTMHNYTLFAGGILFPLSGILFFAIPMFYLKRQGKITPENTINILSHKDLCIIALFDSLNSVIQSIATPYLSVISMTIFNRLSLVGIPFASYIFLKTKYLPNHYLGIFLTIYGITITFIPNILNHKSIGNEWLLLYILGILPGVGSYIYKENAHVKEISKQVPADENSSVSFSERLPTIRKLTEMLVRETIRRTQGNQSIAARILGISQQALSKRLKQLTN